MTNIGLRNHRRIYLTIAEAGNGRYVLRGHSHMPASGPYTLAAYVNGMLRHNNVEIPIASVGSELLGTITLAQTAAIAISAGTRRLTVSTPLAWNVRAGDDLALFPVSIPAGYATHDVAVTADNTISVGLTAPLLAIGASYSIQCRVWRFN
jgi:hypothetical protein